jgi:hypothetical protein
MLIVGSQKVWAIEKIYQKCLLGLGVDAELYPMHDEFYDFYYRGVLNKIIYKFNPVFIYQKLNEKLIQQVEQFGPDIVWVFKGMEIFPQTLQLLKSSKVKLVNFNPDHPFMFSGKGSGNKNVFNSIDLYDLHFCYHRQVMKRIEDEFHVPCAYLPFGYGPVEVELPSAQDEILKACFIGNPDKKRAHYLQHLIDNNVPLDVFGNSWRDWLNPRRNTGIFPAIYGDEFNKIAPLYRVQINIFREHNEGSHNMRTFETPGLGCIMVAPDSPEHRGFFKEQQEVFYYVGKEELLDKCMHCISLEYHKAKEIRRAAMDRCISEGYNYYGRSKQVINLIK